MQDDQRCTSKLISSGTSLAPARGAPGWRSVFRRGAPAYEGKTVTPRATSVISTMSDS